MVGGVKRLIDLRLKFFSAAVTGAAGQPICLARKNKAISGLGGGFGRVSRLPGYEKTNPFREWHSDVGGCCSPLGALKNQSHFRTRLSLGPGRARLPWSQIYHDRRVKTVWLGVVGGVKRLKAPGLKFFLRDRDRAAGQPGCLGVKKQSHSGPGTKIACTAGVSASLPEQTKPFREAALAFTSGRTRCPDPEVPRRPGETFRRWVG